MDIRSYLVDVAESITAAAPALPEKEAWEAWRKERKQAFLEMLGIDRYLAEPRTPLQLEVKRTFERDGYRVECLSFESLPGLRVDGNLYIPDGPGPHPAILYVCGHSPLQKASHYQQHARRYAKLGFVTLIIDTVHFGEVRGYHHGPYRYGWFHWYSRGYTPAGIETWNGIRALDLLVSRDEVDPERLGVTGTSGGGAMSWWIAAADERVKVSSPSCGTATIASHVRYRTIDGHCDCMFPINLYGWSLIDMAALIAPRPVLIVSADRDDIFAIDAIEDFYRRLRRVYEHLGVPENLDLFTFRAPHSYQELSRRRTFQWFLKHLMGRDVDISEVADIDAHVEEPGTLAVYPKGLPGNNRASTVHDWFVPLASPPRIESAEDLARERAAVVSKLRKTTFSAFPDPLDDPQARIVWEWMSGNGEECAAFAFQTERGWELRGAIAGLGEDKARNPVIITLMNPEDRKGPEGSLGLGGAPAGWRRAAIAPRGTDVTAWHPNLQWHLRRAAALTGRTLASLRVLDTLQGIRAVRSLFKPSEVYLHARGEMAAVALYAALLDGDVAGLILRDPPATQNAPGNPDGTGPCLEMLGCLKITDLPQVAGLLWPARLVFVGGRPDSYLWAEAVYDKLGAPGGYWNVPALEDWRI